MDNAAYYLAAIALATALAVKLPALRHHWHNPMVRAVGLIIITGGLGFLFGAPSTISTVNRVTGIPNFSGPLVYDIIIGFSASCLLLIIYWRGGPRAHVRRITRRWLIAYGLVIIAVPALFAAGEAPVERLRDLDTYYAQTPYIREMVLTYLLAHTCTATVTIAMCWRWCREVRQWLRAGLITLIIGFVLSLGFGISKLTAVAAAWAGVDWVVLDTSVAPPLAALGALVVTTGFLLPVAGPRLQDYGAAWLTYCRLNTLVKHLNTRREQGASPKLPWWSGPALRLTQRETEIHDCLLTLTPYLDAEIRDEAARSAARQGHPHPRAQAIGAAAMLTAAHHAKQADLPTPHDTTPAAAALAAVISTGGPGELAEISRHMKSPAVVAAASHGRRPRPETDSRQIQN
ncbi:MAB_1171c family putative transporter [Streptomyces sp. NPDC002851]